MKKVGRIFPILLAVFFVAGCAWFSTLPTQEKVVVSYEGVALSLNTVKAYIKGKEMSGQLTGAKLDEIVAQWEMSRQLFLAAGEALKASIAAQDPATQQERLKAYNALLEKAALELGKIEKGGN